MADKKKKTNAAEGEETEQTTPVSADTADKPEVEEPRQDEPKEPDYKAELNGANDRYLRLLAEYDNYRKRSQKEKENLYAELRADTVAQFLPVYDNLMRALAQSTEDEAYRKGVEMIMTQFCATLEKLGVTKIESLGQSFDPNRHNAVMHVEDESVGENTVVEEFQKGFVLGDRVIRFSVVKVAN